MPIFRGPKNVPIFLHVVFVNDFIKDNKQQMPLKGHSSGLKRTRKEKAFSRYRECLELHKIRKITPHHTYPSHTHICVYPVCMYRGGVLTHMNWRRAAKCKNLCNSWAKGRGRRWWGVGGLRALEGLRPWPKRSLSRR